MSESHYFLYFCRRTEKNGNTYMNLPIPDIYYAAACFAFVLSSLFCGVVRWFHMCRPFDREEAYFYPARRLITFIFLCFTLEAVYLFHPREADTWLFIRSFLVIFLPAMGALSFKRYFFGEEKRRRLRIVLVGGVPVLAVGTLFLMACLGRGILERHHTLVLTAVGGLGLVLNVCLLRASWWLYTLINAYQHEEYSNKDDFPVRFASGVIALPMLIVLAAWAVFLTGSREVNAWLNGVMMLTNVAILIAILHPQRKKCKRITDEMEEAIQEAREEEEDVLASYAAPAKKANIPEAVKDEIERNIRKALIEERLFLNPNLRMTDLKIAANTNRSYVSYVLGERFGPFYSVLSNLRIEYAIAYAKEHPNASSEEIALQSGFSTTRTYRKTLDDYKKKAKKS